VRFLPLSSKNWANLRLPLNVHKQKVFQLQGASPPWPPTTGSAPGPRWGLRPQTSVIGSRSARSRCPPLCQILNTPLPTTYGLATIHALQKATDKRYERLDVTVGQLNEYSSKKRRWRRYTHPTAERMFEHAALRCAQCVVRQSTSCARWASLSLALSQSGCGAHWWHCASLRDRRHVTRYDVTLTSLWQHVTASFQSIGGSRCWYFYTEDRRKHFQPWRLLTDGDHQSDITLPTPSSVLTRRCIKQRSRPY